MPATDAPSATPDKVTLLLNWLADGTQAGFHYAKVNGIYDEYGLDVTLQEGNGSGTTSQVVAQGSVQFGYANAPSAMAVRAEGGKVTVIAHVLPSPFGVLSLRSSGIDAIADLKGKRIAADPGAAEIVLLPAVLGANGLDMSDVEVVNVAGEALVGVLLQGEVDAILGADFEAIQIKSHGEDPVLLLYRDNGAPSVGLSVIGNDDFLAEHPDLATRFVEASLKGWEAAKADPEAATQAVQAEFEADHDDTLAQLQGAIPALCAGSALGSVSDDFWEASLELLIKYQQFSDTAPATDYYTTKFLPSPGFGC